MSSVFPPHFLMCPAKKKRVWQRVCFPHLKGKHGAKVKYSKLLKSGVGSWSQNQHTILKRDFLAGFHQESSPSAL